MKHFRLIILAFFLSQGIAQGIFQASSDLGNVGYPGSASYDEKTLSYTLEGSGSNMWFDHDAFHFLWKKIKGDFILRARVRFIGTGVDPHRKLGLMARNSLDSTSAYVDVAVHGDGLTSMQFRRGKSMQTEEARSPVHSAEIIQLQRQGNRFIMSVAQKGDTLTHTLLDSVYLNDELYVGLFICAHNNTVLEKGIFENVQLILPGDEKSEHP